MPSASLVPRVVLALPVLAAQGYVPWNLQDDYNTATLAGQAAHGHSDGTLENATFHRPSAVAIDPVAQELYVADTGSHRIRRVRVGFGNASDFVTTLAGDTRGYRDGVGRKALFNEPVGLAVDGHTRLLFVADAANMVVRQIDLDTEEVTTLAGSFGVSGFINGRGQAAAFYRPVGLALALRSRQLYVCDPYNHAVRVVHVVSREVRTLAGNGADGATDGAGEAASFHFPTGVSVNDDESAVYVVEKNQRVRLIATAIEPTYPPASLPEPPGAAFSDAVTTLLDGTSQGLEELTDVALAYGWPGGAVLLIDTRGDRLYRLGLGIAASPPPPSITSDANGTALGATNGMSADGSNSSGVRLRALRPLPHHGARTLQSASSTGGGANATSGAAVVGGGAGAGAAMTTATTIVICPQGVAAGAGQECDPQLARLVGSTPGFLDGMGARTRLYQPRGLAVDYTTRSVYVADSYNHRVRIVHLTDIVQEIAVDREEWYELLARALRQNLVFILSLVGSILLLGCLTYACCRCCSLCPLYQRRLHTQRMKSMEIGQRA